MVLMRTAPQFSHKYPGILVVLLKTAVRFSQKYFFKKHPSADLHDPLQVRAAREDGAEVRGQDPRGVQDGGGGVVRERVRRGLRGQGEARLHEHPAAGVQRAAQEEVPEDAQETVQAGMYRVSHAIVREVSSCFVLGVPLPCLIGQ